MKNKKNFLIISITVIILFLSLIFIKHGKQNKQTTIKTSKESVITTTINQEKKDELSLVMVGDCLIHQTVYKAAQKSDGTYSFSDMFTKVKPLIENKDIAYYNQESIIGGKSLGLSTYPRFNSPEEIGDDMINLGFNTVGLANNHTMDKGEIGVVNSVNYWKTKPGVYYTGQALSNEDRQSNIKIKEVNNIKYVFLSYTTVTNGLLPPEGKEYLTNIYSKEKVENDISSVKDKVDLIIVAMHWGVEYQNKENQEQHKIAEELSNMGVNLIIGTHPHVIQPVSYVNDTLVFYSLGNFISSQDTSDKLTGAVASLTISKKDDKIEFDNIKVNLIYTSFVRYSPYNFMLYPYELLDSSILYGYEDYYNKYKAILTSEEETVEVANLR